MKHIVLVLAVVLSLTAAVSASGIRLEVRVPAGPAAAGETFQVETHLSGNEDFRSLQFVLTYDADRLECTKVNAGTLIRDALWAGNPASPKGAAFAAAASDTIQGDGQAAVFTFRARENLTEIDIRPAELYVFGAGNLEGIQLPASAAILSVPRSDAASPASGQGTTPSGTTVPTPQQNGPSSSATASSSDTAAPSSGTLSSSDTAAPSSETLSSSDTAAPSFGTLSSSDTAAPSSGTLPSSDTAAPSSGTLPSSDTAAPSSDITAPSSGQERTAPSGGQAGQSGTQPAGAGGDSAPSIASPFTDTAGTWAERDITEASRRGLFHGYPDGTFRPNNVITRGQYVLVLWNLAGRPAPAKTPPFRDLGSLSDEFRDAIAWAWENGYVNGTAPDRFSSGGYLTRQAAMKILYGFNGGESGTELLFTGAYDSVYQDSGKLSAWAREGVYWAVYHGILRGVSSTMLNPAGVLTRAQLAAVMIRYTDKFPAS